MFQKQNDSHAQVNNRCTTRRLPHALQSTGHELKGCLQKSLNRKGRRGSAQHSSVVIGSVHDA